jgi:exodeoxyribonuclease V beta subunit
MIDEFQDTDPQQYRIFRRIWRRQADTALLLIGDPKQAIYAFRGADIFTYMKARGDVTAHYTLDTNWRSAPGMVDSVNRLFSLSDNPFMFREIPFMPVKSADKNQGLRFTVDDAAVPAMNIWLMSGEAVGRGITRRLWPSCARRKFATGSARASRARRCCGAVKKLNPCGLRTSRCWCAIVRRRR